MLTNNIFRIRKGSYNHDQYWYKKIFFSFFKVFFFIFHIMCRLAKTKNVFSSFLKFLFHRYLKSILPVIYLAIIVFPVPGFPASIICNDDTISFQVCVTMPRVSFRFSTITCRAISSFFFSTQPDQRYHSVYSLMFALKCHILKEHKTSN